MGKPRWSERPPPTAEPVSTAALLADAARRLGRVTDNAHFEALGLLWEITGVDPASLLAFPERRVPVAVVAALEECIGRRELGEPFAYIVGTRGFHAQLLFVDSAVLIPRPETELLVENALERCARLVQPSLLDLGTGSWAIAIAVKASRPDMHVVGTDVSEAAIGVARENCINLSLSEPDLCPRWIVSSWFAALSVRFDIIVCNPPYVCSADIKGSLTFEPRVALDGGVDGLDAYRVLLAEAPEHLNPGGALLLEHGAEQRETITDLARATGWRVVRALDDLAGRPRVLELDRGAP